MNVSDAIAVGRSVNARRYTAPADWSVVPVADLLRGSSRESLASEQLSLLASTARSSDGAVALNCAGDIGLLKLPCISIIGTRKVSREGAARARRLAKELAARGVVIVSGLAEGVDTEAMTSAIQNGGHTVGVIGTPLDQAYPASNKELQETVYRDHLLLSQFRSGDRVFKSNFPQRNRTMALLSDATVVIEASDTSGTLHQAAECMRLGRWLFIARSVVDNPALAWPAKFTHQSRCRILDSTDGLMSIVYG